MGPLMEMFGAGSWSPLLVALPLIVGLIAYVMPGRVAAVGAYGLPPVMAALLVMLGMEVLREDGVRYCLGGWDRPWGIELVADGIAVVMLGMTVLVMSSVGIHAIFLFGRGGRSAAGGGSAAHGAAPTDRQAGSTPYRVDSFWPLFFLLWGSLNALFLTGDVFNAYVTLELLTLASVGLVLVSPGHEPAVASLRYLLRGLFGSLLYLLGVAILYGAYAVLDIGLLAAAMEGTPLDAIALTLMLLGLLIKAAVFPLHGWLPPAHSIAVAPVSAVLSALVVKAAFYLVLRLWLTLGAANLASHAGLVLGMMGAGAVLWGSLQAIRSERLKVLIAYSTVAQLGYLLLVFPLMPAGIPASAVWKAIVYFALAHACAKAALFCAAGCIGKYAGHDRIADLKGIGPRLPITLSATALAGVSLMGLPPSGGFIAKWSLLVASLEQGQWWWAVVLVLGGFLTAIYLLRFWQVALTTVGAPADEAENDAGPVEVPPHPQPLRLRMELPGLVLGIAAVLLGFVAMPIMTLLDAGQGGSAVVRRSEITHRPSRTLPSPLLCRWAGRGEGAVESADRLKPLIEQEAAP